MDKAAAVTFYSRTVVLSKFLPEAWVFILGEQLKE